MKARFYFLSLHALYLPLMSLTTQGGEVEPAQILASWVQYVAAGVEARVVTRGACPSLELDGQSTAMEQRALPTDLHPSSVCSALLPAGTKRIRLLGKALPTPVLASPSRVIVIGDTGCRVSAKHGIYQDCNNSSIWPFGQVAESVRESRPDLIIHTGDYIYRESPCPDANRGCKGTPWGDNQETWIADFFAPSAAARAAAPLLLVRGNHEDCERAGEGWFRYLDAYPFSGECRHSTEPWVMQSGDLRIAVLDSSEGKSVDGQSLAARYAGQLGRIAALQNGPDWIATHRPFWGFGADDDSGRPFEVSDVLQRAVQISGLPGQTRLLVGGHLHLAELLGFGGQRPPQLIVGNSGTGLDPIAPPPAEIDGLRIATQRAFFQYGFATVDRLGVDDWRIAFRDRIGRTIEECRLFADVISCSVSPRNSEGCDPLRSRLSSGQAVDLRAPAARECSRRRNYRRVHAIDPTFRGPRQGTAKPPGGGLSGRRIARENTEAIVPHQEGAY